MFSSALLHSLLFDPHLCSSTLRHVHLCDNLNTIPYRTRHRSQSRRVAALMHAALFDLVSQHQWHLSASRRRPCTPALVVGRLISSGAPCHLGAPRAIASRGAAVRLQLLAHAALRQRRRALGRALHLGLVLLDALAQRDVGEETQPAVWFELEGRARQWRACVALLQSRREAPSGQRG